MCTWKMSQTSGVLQGKAAVSAVPADGGHRRWGSCCQGTLSPPQLALSHGAGLILYNFYVFPSYSRYSATHFKAQIAAEQ